MMHFLRADSWNREDIFTTWAQTVSEYAPLKRISGRAVLIGDGVKRVSDGRYMPCTKKMVQESEDSSKPTFIHGHLWGAVGILAGNAAKSSCLPLSIQIYDGDSVISDWLGDGSVSHVVQMLRDGFRVARHIGQSLFVLNRYSLTRLLQFVFVDCGQTCTILICTDLTMPAEDIITAYAYRFKIEAMFREMGQHIGGLFYHFWTNAAPRLDRYRRKGTDDPLTQVKDRHEQQRIIKKLSAIEGYVMLGSIAMGIIQMLCLMYDGKIRVSDFRYLRTPSHQVMSGASMMEYLRRDLFRFMAQQSGLTIAKIISSEQVSFEKEAIDRLIT